MLNGVAPLLIFSFPIIPKLPILSGLPIIQDALDAIGVPIPLYLDEKLTGICVLDEEKSIDIDSQPQQTPDGVNLVNQRGVSNTVTINMVANKDSFILSALLSFSDLIFTKVVGGGARVSYLNGPTMVFNGLLHGFSTKTDNNDDLLRITMILQKTNQQTTLIASIKSVTPLAGTAAGPGA